MYMAMADDSGDAALEQEEEEEIILDEKLMAPVSVMEQDANPAELLSGPISTTPPTAPAGPALSKELLQVEVELRLLEALEIYHPAKLKGIHRHFVLFGLMDYLERRLNHHFSAEEILELLDRFYNLELLKPNEEDSEFLSQEEEFSLPASILSVKEEAKESS